MNPVERCATRCAEPAWRLAYALLRDSHAALDAVQQAFLVASRKPSAVPAGDPWPWFRVVVAHEARNFRRKHVPRTNSVDAGPDSSLSEAPMDVSDHRTPSPPDAAIAADEARRVARAVDSLEPDVREAVLLVHLGELTHAEAADVLGLPRQTVTDRARRGVESLSRALSRHAAAATGTLALLPIASPPAGMAEATRVWVETAIRGAGAGAGVGAGAGSTAILSTIGGGAMATSKAGLWLGLVVAAGAGFFGGAATGGFGVFDAGGGDGRAAPSRPPARLDAPPSESVAATTLAPAPSAAMDPADDGADPAHAALLRRQNERLAARVAELEREAATTSSSARAKGPLFTFGDVGRLDAVREADWPALAAASKVVGDAIVEILRRTDAGQEVPREVHLRLQENVERMRTYEYRTIDRIPTAAPHNGELTHPISAANLLAAQLDAAGKPLSPIQVAEFERLGLAFEEEFARTRKAWDAAVPRARRLLEEVRLKGRFMDGLWAALTDDQRPVWIDPSLRGVASVDLFDPTLMVIHTSPILTGATVAEMRPKLIALLRPKTGLPADAAAARLEAVVDPFLAKAARGLDPVPRSRARNYTFAQAVAAGEATVELVEALLRDPELPAERRTALLDDAAWYVPRLLVKE